MTGALATARRRTRRHLTARASSRRLDLNRVLDYDFTTDAARQTSPSRGLSPALVLLAELPERGRVGRVGGGRRDGVGLGAAVRSGDETSVGRAGRLVRRAEGDNPALPR